MKNTVNRENVRDGGKNGFLKKTVRGMLLLLLSFSMLFVFLMEKKSYASYVNTNLNTFFHDVQNIPTGYPGQQMEVKVRVGYNGVNGLANPNTDEIKNVRVRQRRTVLQERIRIIPTKMPERMMSRERHKRTHGTRDIKQERTMPIKTG